MNTGGEAAEQIVRMSLEGFEVAVKISGAGAKNIAALLYAILKEETKTRGKARLTPLLRSGKELKVFTVKREDLKKFTKEAKKYGVLYRVLVDRKNKSPGAAVDILARAEDAPKINRIVERFRLASVDKSSILTEPEKHKETENHPPEADTNVEKSEGKEELLDALLGKSEEAAESRPNPSEAEKEPSPPSEPGSRPSGKSEEADLGTGTATSKKGKSLTKKGKPPIKKEGSLGKKETYSAIDREKKPSVREAIQKIQKNRQRQRADIPLASSRRPVSNQKMRSPSKGVVSDPGKRSPGKQAASDQAKRNQARGTGHRQVPRRKKPGRTKGAR